MELTGEYKIPAPRQTVWEGLNDPETLKACIPGCEELEKSGDDSFAAKVKSKIGPVSAKFSGEVTLSDLNPPESYTISGEGKGGAAGFAKGSARVNLAEDGPDATVLTYTANAQVGGKLAQVGSRLVKGAAQKTADQFFSKFAEVVGGGAQGADAQETSSEPTPGETAEMQAAAMSGAAVGHTPPEGATLSTGATGDESESPAEAATKAVDAAAARKSYGPVAWVFMVIAVIVILLAVFVFGQQS